MFFRRFLVLWGLSLFASLGLFLPSKLIAQSELPSCEGSEWFSEGSSLIGTTKSEYKRLDGSKFKATKSYELRSVFRGEDSIPDHVYLPISKKLEGEVSSLLVRVQVGDWSERFELSTQNRVRSGYQILGFKFQKAWEKTIPFIEENEEAHLKLSSEPIRFILEEEKKPLCEYQISVNFSE
jgi:hypothetical protein